MFNAFSKRPAISSAPMILSCGRNGSLAVNVIVQWSSNDGIKLRNSVKTAIRHSVPVATFLMTMNLWI
jgi:hypothetical protein